MTELENALRALFPSDVTALSEFAAMQVAQDIDPPLKDLAYQMAQAGAAAMYIILTGDVLRALDEVPS